MQKPVNLLELKNIANPLIYTTKPYHQQDKVVLIPVANINLPENSLQVEIFWLKEQLMPIIIRRKQIS